MNFLLKARILFIALGIAIIGYKFGPLQSWHLAWNVITFLLIISIIVFIHEFGHYIVAKWAGVKIDIFSIGFGKELLGWNDRSGTRWRVSALPFGGYVKMYGDASEASTPLESIANLPEEEKQKTFYFKPLYKKALIVIAGPVSNFILTILILTLFIATKGMPSTEPLVGEVLKNMPAEAAGLMVGDRVVSVNSEKVETFNDIPQFIMTNLGTPVNLEILRNNKIINVTLTPKQITEKDSLGNDYTHPIIGFKSKQIVYENVGPLRAISEATRATYQICKTTLHAIGQMIMGDRSAKDIKGPLGIAKLSGQAADKGIYTVFWFMAMLSANLGLINLFPVPMLDGGHLLYYGIEAVQGKPLAKRFQEYGFRIGMAMVAMLMMFAIVNDIKNLLS
jgi:regulator of sigma E protease